MATPTLTRTIRSYQVLLKFKPESFTTIQKWRNENTKFKNSSMPEKVPRHPEPFPYMSILSSLPPSLSELYQQTLSKLATEISPITLQTSAAQAIQRNTVRGSPDRRDIVFPFDQAPVQQLRAIIYGSLKDAVEQAMPAGKKYSLDIYSSHSFSTYSQLAVQMAERKLEEVRKASPNGAGELIVEALCLMEYYGSKKRTSYGDGFAGEYTLRG